MATNKSEQKNNEKSADAGLLSEVDLLFETSW